MGNFFTKLYDEIKNMNFSFDVNDARKWFSIIIAVITLDVIEKSTAGKIFDLLKFIVLYIGFVGAVISIVFCSASQIFGLEFFQVIGINIAFWIVAICQLTDIIVNTINDNKIMPDIIPFTWINTLFNKTINNKFIQLNDYLYNELKDSFNLDKSKKISILDLISIISAFPHYIIFLPYTLFLKVIKIIPGVETIWNLIKGQITDQLNQIDLLISRFPWIIRELYRFIKWVYETLYILVFQSPKLSNDKLFMFFVIYFLGPICENLGIIV